MTNIVDHLNQGAIRLRDVKLTFDNLPPEASDAFLLSKSAPYFGYVEAHIADCPPFLMFSNNDDFVAKRFFWQGKDAYEPMSMKIWLGLAKRAAQILDIGAYTGVYALAAASQNRKSKVAAFEAIDLIYARLLVNKTVNSLGNLSVENLAVSNTRSSVTINVRSGDSVLSTGSTIMQRAGAATSGRQKVVGAVSADDYCEERGINRIDLVKIDVEGAEHLVFQGLQQQLSRSRPDIICELLPGAALDAIHHMLAPLGYHYYRIDDRSMTIRRSSALTEADGNHTLNTLMTVKSEADIMSLA